MSQLLCEQNLVGYCPGLSKVRKSIRLTTQCLLLFVPKLIRLVLQKRNQRLSWINQLPNYGIYAVSELRQVMMYTQTWLTLHLPERDTQ